MKTFFSLLIASLAFFSCNKKNDQPVEQPTVGNNVYVAGAVSLPDGSGSIACYWKNGTRIALEVPAGYSGMTTTITAGANGDIYILGSYSKNGMFKSCYWKNGTRIDIEPLAGFSTTFVNDIFISGDDIYLAGMCTSTYPPSVPCYWKNGSPVRITDVIDPSQSSLASSISVLGSDIYLVGYCGQYGNIETACMWKNGVRSNLYFTIPVGKRSRAVKMKLDGDHVYIGGVFDNEANTATTVFVWGGGVGNPVAPTKGSCQVQDIDLVGNTVYSAGTFINNYGLQSPGYWKDIYLISLPGLNKDAGFANGIHATGADTYVAGHVYSSNGTTLKPVFWKNSVLTELSVLDNTKGGLAFDVYVGK